MTRFPNWVRILLPALLALAPLSVRAGDTPRPYALPQTEVYDTQAVSNGQPYRIYIARPAQPAPPKGYPVIYALDGNATFATLAQTVSLQTRPPHGFGPAIVVGIGYPTDEPFDTDRRYLDLTPPTPAHYLPTKGGKTPSAVGGAGTFLAFIQNELKPQIEARFPVDRQRQALTGHSLGGRFVLQVLFQQPQAFRYYIASSPSLWWGNQSTLADEKAFPAKLAALAIKPELRIIVGADEKNHMVEDARAIAERLQPLRAQGLRSDFWLRPGENHISVLPQTLNHSVRFVLDSAP